MTKVNPSGTHHAEKISASLGPGKRKDALSDNQNNSIAKPKIIYSGMFCGSHYVLSSNHDENGIIAVDFDGVLFKTFEPYDPRKAGAPVMKMINYVRKLIKQGRKVVIFTARVNTKEHTPEQIKYTHKLIGGLCKKYLGKKLPITAEKHHMMKVFYDDRAMQVERNTGKIIK